MDSLVKYGLEINEIYTVRKNIPKLFSLLILYFRLEELKVLDAICVCAIGFSKNVPFIPISEAKYGLKINEIYTVRKNIPKLFRLITQ